MGVLYTGGDYMHKGDYARGYYLWQEKKGGKDSQHLQSFNSGILHFTLENKNKTSHHVNSSADFSRTTTLESVVSIQENSTIVIDVWYHTVVTTC